MAGFSTSARLEHPGAALIAGYVKSLTLWDPLEDYRRPIRHLTVNGGVD